MISPACRARPSFEDRDVPVGGDVLDPDRRWRLDVIDCSLAKKSPPLMVATWVFESADQAPMRVRVGRA